MRLSFSYVLAALLILSGAPQADAQASAPNVFTTNLSLGSSGTQVLALQKILNRDSDTHVADTGVGSPGNETNYFGLLTKAAVIRFQEKYVSEILSPSGLLQGNGYVRFYTRAKLNALSVLTMNAEPAGPSAPSPVTTPGTGVVSSQPSASSPSALQNPNLKNIDRFLAALDTVAAKQKLSVSAIATVKQQVLKDVATTTDLRATFLKMVQDKSYLSANYSYTDKVLAAIEQVFGGIFNPKRAYAATGVPFGGALLFSFYCTQSQTWLITLEPLPPSYAALLTYIPFSQAYLSYNIPGTPWLLGEYEPGAGVCVAGACPYCVTIPSEGMISPKTGSAPL